jgi:Uma2 family endonuclease
MITPREIRRAIEVLPLGEREALFDWFEEGFRSRAPMEVREAAATYGMSVQETWTIEEYFELEERSTLRHEYINGAIYAMNGVSHAHNFVSLALASALRQHLRGGPCRVFSGALRLDLKLGDDRICYYPDVMVACDKEGWGTHSIHNPKLVIEVLSPTTERTDLREKTLTFKRLPSVEEYAIAAQRDCRVTVHRRTAGWEPQTYAGSDTTLELRSVGLKVPLSEIYREVLADH